MELGSPMTKMRKVTTSQEAEPSMSRELSQEEQVIDFTHIGDSPDEEMVFEAATAHPVKVRSKPLGDDDVFTGLVDCDDDKGGDDDDENEDNEEFPGCIEMPDSDYSDFGAEGDQDSYQLEMQVICDQQQKNRNTGQVSEIKLIQVKAEIEDTEDTGDQEMYQTSLETEDSFIPLSMGDTEGQSTLPSSEDVEATTQDQEGTLVTEEVKVSEKPKVARQPTKLYQLPA